MTVATKLNTAAIIKNSIDPYHKFSLLDDYGKIIIENIHTKQKKVELTPQPIFVISML